MKKPWQPIALWLALLTPALLLLTADRWLPMSWRDPGQFAWLSLLPILGLFFAWALRRRESVMEMFAHARLLTDLASGIAPGWQWLRMGMMLLAFTVVVMSLARPRWGSETIKTTQSNLDIILAIDTSKSMLAGDLQPSRLERVKLAAKELKKLMPGDRFAIMPFAGAAFLQCPLTSEEGIFRQNIEAIRVGAIPVEGTSLARVIDEAAKAFADDPTRQKVIVLFTDGEDHEGEAVEMAKRVKGDGIKIFTIGAGSAAGDVIAVRRCPACHTHNPVTRKHCITCNANLPDADYLRDEDDQLVQSTINEKLLRELASASGEFYLPLRGTQTMATLHKNGLAPLAMSDDTGTVEKEIAREQFRWPLAAAVLLLLGELFIPTRRRLAGGPTVLLAILFILPTEAQAGPWDWVRKKFSGTPAEKLPVIDDRSSDSHAQHYNRGILFYRQAGEKKDTQDKRNDLKEAINHFVAALDSDDLVLQQKAFYNLGNAHFRQGQAQIAGKKDAFKMLGDSARQPVQATLKELIEGNKLTGDQLKEAEQWAESKTLLLAQLTAAVQLILSTQPEILKTRPNDPWLVEEIQYDRTQMETALSLALSSARRGEIARNLAQKKATGRIQNIKQRIALWEDATAHLAAAAKLDPTDADAAANLIYVRTQLKREKDKLDNLTTRIPLGGINRLKQQDAVALAIFPPSKESMPEKPYWRMLVFDQYENGVGSTSSSLLSASTALKNGSHISDFGGRAPPPDEKMPGEWKFHFEPLISKHLPLPGPFEKIVVPVRRAYRHNDPTLFTRLEELPAKQVRYRVMFPADTRRIAAAPQDLPLASGTVLNARTYPGTTLALHLSLAERQQLDAVVRHLTGGQPLTAEAFTAAATKYLQDNHAYTRDSRIDPSSRNGDPVLRWMITNTPGHCEFFAYSFQMLARAAGHPTRVIGGLAGAEFSQKEKRHIAKLSDLHAWCEIFDGDKWVRVDPTPPEENQNQGEGQGEEPQQQPSETNPQGNNSQPNGQQPQPPDSNQELDNSGEEDLTNDGENGEEQEGKLSHSEALELLEAARDQEKPLLFAPGREEFTNERRPEFKRRKNW